MPVHSKIGLVGLLLLPKAHGSPSLKADMSNWEFIVGLEPREATGRRTELAATGQIVQGMLLTFRDTTVLFGKL